MRACHFRFNLEGQQLEEIGLELPGEPRETLIYIVYIPTKHSLLSWIT